MDIKISERAREFVLGHGGTVYVKTTHSRCCSGTLTMFDVSTDVPLDVERYARWDADGVEVRYLTAMTTLPDELSIDVKGRRRVRLEAYWDGCLYRP